MSTVCTRYTPGDCTSRNGTEGDYGSGDYRRGEPLFRLRDAGPALRVLSKLKAAMIWPLRVLRARRELEMLARMSENELKDIGLTRTDVGDATALPADASPTEFLAARIEERIGRKAA